ncbi:DUF11 domain-containing protein [Candidatus Micrarchaeota archaeon]|nr:DUF11 domain-containing protein [Candidatus Micrarchaeota archaeon]
MFRSKFVLLAAIFILFAGTTFAYYSDLGGGWCVCGNPTGCVDCTAALNNNTHCYNGVIADGGELSGAATCIDDPPNFENKTFDLNGSSIENTVGGPRAIYLEHNNNVTIANGSIGMRLAYADGIYLKNVSLADVHNMTINGTGVTPPPGFGIFLGEALNSDAYSSESVIYNCTIYNSSSARAAIYIQYCDDNEVWDVNAATSGNGIAMYGARNNYVHDCVADDSLDADSKGFACFSDPDRESINNTFERVNASGNFYGAYVYMCRDSTVSSSRFLSNGYGTYINRGGAVSGTVHNITFRDNYLSANPAYGLVVEDDDPSPSSVSRFINNTIQGSFYGIYLNQTENNTFEDNRISTNSLYGILAINSSNATFERDMVRASGIAGIGFDSADNSMLRDVHLFSNAEDIFVVSSIYPYSLDFNNVIFDDSTGSYNDFTNLSMSDNVALNDQYSISWTENSTALPADTASFANKWVNISNGSAAVSIDQLVWHWTDSELSAGYFESNFELWKYGISSGTWSNEGAILDTTANTLTINNLNPASDYGILQNLSTCPVITSSGGYQLQADLVGAPNPVEGGHGLASVCVLINTSDVYLDCNGHKISGNGIPGDVAGLLVNGSAGNIYQNITLFNCSFDSYGNPNDGYGAFLYYAGNSTLSNCTFRNNTDYGLQVENSGDINISMNRFFNNSVGLQLFSSDNNNVTSNYAYNNTFPGMLFYDSDTNLVFYNSAYNNSDSGFIFAVGSTGNIFISNNATENAAHGLRIFNSSDNGFGLNRLYNNTLNGIFLDSSHSTSGSPNMFYNDYCDDNGMSGINSTNSTYGEFVGSSARWNALDGAYVEDSDNIIFIANEFDLPLFPNKNFINRYNTRHGFYLLDSANSIVGGSPGPATRNTYVEHNGQDGIRLEDTSDSFVSGRPGYFMVVQNNTDAGINFNNGDDNNVSFVEIYGNGEEGVNFAGSSWGNNVSNSSIHDNGEEGIFVRAGCQNNLLEFNTVANNSDYGLNALNCDNLYARGLYFYNNTGGDLYVHATNNWAGDFDFLTFGEPLGTSPIENYTLLSIDDAFVNGDNYIINWSTNSTALPAGVTSFEQKWVEITTTSSPSIDELVWGWLASEEPGHDPSIFTLAEYNAGWTILNNTPDTVGRTLSCYNLDPSSDYGILEYNASILVEKTDLTSHPVSPGGMAEFQLNITNDGNATLDPVEVVDTLPGAFTYNNSNLTPDDVTGNVITWDNVGPIAPGGSVLILINATVDTGTVSGTYFNVLDAEGQPSLGSNVTDSTNLGIDVNDSSVAVLKESSAASVQTGQTVTFNITVTNTGEVNLTPIIALDTLPAGLQFNAGEAIPPADSSGPQFVQWDASIPELAPGDTFFAEYNVTLITTGSHQNNVTVDAEPPNGDNATAADAVTVTTPKPPGDGGNPMESMDIEIQEPACLGEEVTITVTSDGDPLQNVEIHIKTLVPGYTHWYTGLGATGTDGELTFTPAFAGEHRVYADKDPGYEDTDETFEVIECEEPEVECMEDDDCPDCYICVLGVVDEYNQCMLGPDAECGVYDPCEPKTRKAPGEEYEDIPPEKEDPGKEEYTDGSPTDDIAPKPDQGQLYACIECSCEPVECLTDDDCEEGQQCIDYECVGEEEPEEGCETDSDCGSDEYCNTETGECEQVECPCGQIINHECSPYECCSNETCHELYSFDYFCNLTTHECEEEKAGEEKPGKPGLDVDAPGEGEVGQPIVITVTSGEDPVPDAEVTVVIDGTPYGMGATNEEGQLEFVPETPGDYVFQVSKEGFDSGREEFVASPGETIWDVIIRGVWIALFILLLIAILYVLYTRRKRERPKDLE